MAFNKINILSENFNPFVKVGGDWVLLTAGSDDSFNTMTASWGGVGVMWNKNVFTAVIRPSRYTYEFVDREDTFSVSMFGGKQHDALALCGAKSGRDCDKVAETGLTPVFLDGTPAFEEAEMILICRKLYRQPLTSDGFVDKTIPDANGSQPLHVAFVGEIIAAYKKA